ncbi:MAG: TPM domain-containing protein [Acidobacteria bacterium]|nr:TPM domain-containing protein [Acidobacteriota bacterium]
MKIVRSGSRYLAAFALLIVCAFLSFAQTNEPQSLDKSPLPQPTEPVNDFAGVLDDATKQRLNQKIKEFKAKTNPPVVLAVAIVKTTGGRPIEEYSLAVYRGWKIGTMNDDNPGALLFIAVDDRRYFTQVGRDLEDELPDGVAGQLQRQYLVPALKQGDYNKGVSDTIDAFMRTIEQKTGTVTPKQEPGKEKSQVAGVSFKSVVCCLVVLAIILFIIFSRRSGSGGKNRNDRDRWGGGGSSGGGWIFLPGGGFGGGSSSSSSWGGSSDWGGGGSSDWGGFGGGGDAGGGGAGGDW